MAEPSRPASHASTGFDVPGWLFEVTAVQGWSVQRTFTRRRVEFVAEYAASGGATAEVTLQALPSATNSSWQLVAKSGAQLAGVVVPARTRISW
jgi:hypothetical protein